MANLGFVNNQLRVNNQLNSSKILTFHSKHLCFEHYQHQKSLNGSFGFRWVTDWLTKWDLDRPAAAAGKNYKYCVVWTHIASNLNISIISSQIMKIGFQLKNFNGYWNNDGSIEGFSSCYFAQDRILHCLAEFTTSALAIAISHSSNSHSAGVTSFCLVPIKKEIVYASQFWVGYLCAEIFRVWT